MISPDERQILMLAHISTGMSGVLEWLDTWAKVELDRLPVVPAEKVAVAQGRCQVLQEITKVLREAPSLAAQPRKRQPPVHTHTDRSV